MLFHQVDIAASGPASLSGHIRKAIACSGADTNSERKTDAMVHKTVKDSAGKHPAKSSSFKDQRHIAAAAHYLFFLSSSTVGADSLYLKRRIFCVAVFSNGSFITSTELT